MFVILPGYVGDRFIRSLGSDVFQGNHRGRHGAQKRRAATAQQVGKRYFIHESAPFSADLFLSSHGCSAIVEKHDIVKFRKSKRRSSWISHLVLQRREKMFANLAKLQPGRAMQKS